MSDDKRPVVSNEITCIVGYTTKEKVKIAAGAVAALVIGFSCWPSHFYRHDKSEAVNLGGLTAPDDEHPQRRCSVFNDVPIDVIALCTFECAPIVARLVWLDASKRHFRAALRAWCLHQAITE